MASFFARTPQGMPVKNVLIESATSEKQYAVPQGAFFNSVKNSALSKFFMLRYSIKRAFGRGSLFFLATKKQTIMIWTSLITITL